MKKRRFGVYDDSKFCQDVVYGRKLVHGEQQIQLTCLRHVWCWWTLKKYLLKQRKSRMWEEACWKRSQTLLQNIPSSSHFLNRQFVAGQNMPVKDNITCRAQSLSSSHNYHPGTQSLQCQKERYCIIHWKTGTSFSFPKGRYRGKHHRVPWWS